MGVQLKATFYHHMSSSWHVAGIVQRVDLGLSFVFKVQLHILNPNIASAWEMTEWGGQLQSHSYHIACFDHVPTWPVADVGHGATFGSDVAQVDFVGLDLDL